MIKYKTIAVLLLTIQTLFLFETSHATTNTASFEVIDISAQFTTTSTEQKLYFLADRKGELSALSVLNTPRNEWQLSDRKSLNLGISNGVYWFKLHLLNTENVESRLVIMHDYAPTDTLSFFAFDSSGKLFQQYKTGDTFAHSTRAISHLSFAFPFILSPTSETIVLMKMQSKGNIIVPISVWNEKSFNDYQTSVFAMFGLLIGVLLITSIYHLFVFAQVRDTLFLSFSIFIVSIAFLLAHQSGMVMKFLWPNSPVLNELAVGFSLSWAIIGHLIFSVQYLQIKKQLLWICQGAAITSLLVASLYSFIPYHTILQTNLLLGVLSLASTLFYAIKLTFCGNKKARVYVMGWAPFILGTVISVAIRFNIIPYSTFSEFAGLGLAVITVVWLSVAIADNINREKTSRIAAQKQAIENLTRYEDLFENAVEGIFTSTEYGKLLRANSALVTMLGFEDKASLFAHYADNTKTPYKHKQHRATLIEKALQQLYVVDEEVELVRADGQSFWASLTLRLRPGEASESLLIEGTMIDISARKITEMKLRYLATHDPLTNIFNRREFEIRLADILENSNDSTIGSVLYMDLDQFKIVNDTCGHTIGDKLLKQITALMNSCLNKRGIMARLGGDEFGVILPGSSSAQALKIAEELLTAIAHFKFVHQDKMFNVGISIGLVELTPGFDSIEAVMSFADTACYAAKDAGRNRVHVYSSDNIEFGKRRQEMEIATLINHALVNNGFKLYRQKIVHNNNEHTIYGYEILLRMQNTGAIVHAPNEFISAAERYGLMHKVDKWVVERTFEWLSHSPEELDAIEACSINLSGQSLGSADFSAHIKNCFKRYAIPHHKVCFEITETHAIEDIRTTIEFITLMQSFGCKFSLDDFGSGLSSYGYLKSLPIDNIKIDGRFVKGIANDATDYAMVESIHCVSKAMGKKTIAEYVENEEIIAHLRDIGIDYLQGFAIDMPSMIEMSAVLKYNGETKGPVSIRGK